MKSLISTPFNFYQMHFSSADVGFVAEMQGGLFRTCDGGLTWEMVVKAPRSHLPQGPTWFHSLSFPTPETGFVGALHFLAVTTNGGSTWEPVGHSDPDQPDRLGLEIAGPVDEEWLKDHPQIMRVVGARMYVVLLAVSFLSPIKGYASVFGGVLLTTGDGGRTWAWVKREDMRPIRRFHYLQDDTCIAVGAAGVILNINPIDNTVSGIENPTVWDLDDVAFRDSEVGLAVGYGDTMLRTVDGGRRWHRVALQTAFSLNGVSWFDQRYAVSVGSEGVILRSEDEGISWYRMELPTDTLLYCVSTPSPQIGYIGGADGLLLKTVDSGRTYRILKFQGNQ